MTIAPAATALAAADPPADSYIGLGLMVLALVGALVMTVIVLVRNRRADPDHDRG